MIRRLYRRVFRRYTRQAKPNLTASNGMLWLCTPPDERHTLREP